jgi:hypothetical protein
MPERTRHPRVTVVLGQSAAGADVGSDSRYTQWQSYSCTYGKNI